MSGAQATTLSHELSGRVATRVDAAGRVSGVRLHYIAGRVADDEIFPDVFPIERTRFEGRIVDLSRSGLRIETTADVPEGAVVEASFILGGRFRLFSPRFTFRGFIRHRAGGHGRPHQLGLEIDPTEPSQQALFAHLLNPLP